MDEIAANKEYRGNGGVCISDGYISGQSICLVDRVDMLDYTVHFPSTS